MGRRHNRSQLWREQRAALDARLGKVRHEVLDRPGATPIAQGELVRLKGYGTGDRRMRFVEYVELPDRPDRSYVTVVDGVRGERGRTGSYISVRPDQLVRVRRQDH